MLRLPPQLDCQPTADETPPLVLLRFFRYASCSEARGPANARRNHKMAVLAGGFKTAPAPPPPKKNKYNGQ